MRILIYIIAYIVVLGFGHLIVRRVLKIFKFESFEKEKCIKGAGATIGLLERAIVLSLTLKGHLAVIAIIFLAKSIGRYKQLNDKRFAEYYLIGTLLSIAFALGVGLLTIKLLNTNWVTPRI